MPVAQPEKIRKIHALIDRAWIVFCEFAKKTVIHENIKIITVLMAVATVASVFFMPHFAKMAVSPEKTAEIAANKTHIPNYLFLDCII